MKSRIMISIAFALSLAAVLLTSSDSTVGAQQSIHRFDTGSVNLGPNQVLRISGDGVDQDDPITFRFRRIVYSPNTCISGVCKHTVASSNLSAPVICAPGEGASFEIPAVQIGGENVGVRGVVLSNRKNVKVTASIIDTVTGEVRSFTTDLIIDVSG